MYGYYFKALLICWLWSLLINSLCGLSDVRKLWKRPVTTSHSVRWHLQTSDDSSRSVSGLIRHILMDRHQLKWLLHCTPQLSSTTAGSTEQHFAAYQSENKSVWMWIIMWLYWWLTLLWHPIGKTEKISLQNIQVEVALH